MDVVLSGFGEEIVAFDGLEKLDSEDLPTGVLFIHGNNAAGTFGLVVNIAVGASASPSAGRFSNSELAIAGEVVEGMSAMVRAFRGTQIGCCYCTDDILEDYVVESRYVGVSGIVVVDIDASGLGFFDLHDAEFLNESTGEEVFVDSYFSPTFTFGPCGYSHG